MTLKTRTNLSDIIPVNLADDELNAEYKTFVDMLGQHFDISWNYIKVFNNILMKEKNILKMDYPMT